MKLIERDYDGKWRHIFYPSKEIRVLCLFCGDREHFHKKETINSKQNKSLADASSPQKLFLKKNYSLNKDFEEYAPLGNLFQINRFKNPI